MQLVPLIPAWAKALAAAAIPALLAVSNFTPVQYAWVPTALAFVAAYLTGQALPAPKWAAGKPLVQGPLVPLLATAVPLLVAFAQSLPTGLPQLAVYGLALLASGVAGLAAPEPLTVAPSNAPTGTVKIAAECSLAEAAQGLCQR